MTREDWTWDRERLERREEDAQQIRIVADRVYYGYKDALRTIELLQLELEVCRNVADAADRWFRPHKFTDSFSTRYHNIQTSLEEYRKMFPCPTGDVPRPGHGCVLAPKIEEAGTPVQHTKEPGFTQQERIALGGRIASARKQAGLTQTDLGAALDPPRSHAAISYLERGATRLTVETLKDVCTILNLPLEHFIGKGES